MPRLPPSIGATARALGCDLERIDEVVDEAGGDVRHVAEQHDRALGFGGRRSEPDAKRGSDPGPIIGIGREQRRQPAERRLDRAPRVADDDDDGARARGERRFHHPAHDRLPVELRDELRLLGAAHGAKA